MNKKLLLLIGLAAMTLASCNKTETVAPTTESQVKDGQIALNFGAYTNRGIATRSGVGGILTTDGSEGLNSASLKEKGFGVFAYYNNGELYNEMSKPDFMYNTQVEYDTNNQWTYSPLRYWPNEFGSNAVSEDVDRLTFFAYAPWVYANPGTGVVADRGSDADYNKSTGIIGMTRNSATGDPFIKYAVDFDVYKTVDLCWGVAYEDMTDVVTGGEQWEVKEDNPFLNVVKPATDTRIKFKFRHALAALNIKIDADFDETRHSESDETDADSGEGFLENTRIYVRSVSFEGFALKGALNLNSSWEDTDDGRTPKWADLGCTGILSEEPVTIYDGRRDGKEGRDAENVKTESPLGLNQQLIQYKPYAYSGISSDQKKYEGFTTVEVDRLGVTHKTTNLFAVQDPTDADQIDAPVFVIPTGGDLKITIVYDVETADPNLSGYLSDGQTHGVSVQNAITKEITIGDDPFKLEAGKKYAITLHLGMTSVKFDAEVEAWDDENADESWHPINS